MAPVRAALLLTGFSVLPVADYDAILAAEDAACALRYPQLR